MNALYRAAMVNWKSSGLGVGIVLVSVGTFLVNLLDGDDSTTASVEAMVAGVMTGIGLILVRDGDKSSQDVGIRADPPAPKKGGSRK